MIFPAIIFNLENPPHYIKYGRPAIYLITNSINDKIYVGSTSNINKRYYKYKSCINRKKNTHIELAIKKYGFDKFTFRILEFVNISKEDLNYFRRFLALKEQYWLDFYQAYNKKNGYNTARYASSSCGVTASKETRKRISESVLRRRDEISAQQSLRVLQIESKTLKVVAEYKSVLDAINNLKNLGGRCIYNACYNKKRAYGYYWCYKHIYEKDGFSPYKKKKKFTNGKVSPIMQLNLDGSIFKIWETTTEANKIGRYDFTLMSKCCKNPNKTYNGFKWKKVSDPILIKEIKEKRYERFLNAAASS